MLHSAFHDSLIGQTLVGRYLVTERLSQGGMGGIYLATQHPLGRTVALKVLLEHHANDPTSVARFEKEARAISSLVHPHIVTVFDFGQMESGALFMAMEYLPGDSLRALIDRQKRLTWDRTLPILCGVVSGLSEAHCHGIIHRDLKPENIVIVHAGNDPNFPKILDFGVARTLETEGEVNLTSRDVIPGTPTYIAPERLEGAAGDAQADLYSLGAMWFEMLTGQPPFMGTTSMQVIMQHLQKAPPSLKEVAPHLVLPAQVEPLIQALLEKNPKHRFQSAEELLAELASLSTEEHEDWGVHSAKEHAWRSTIAPVALPTPSTGNIATAEVNQALLFSAAEPSSEAPLSSVLSGALEDASAEPILLSKKKTPQEPILLSKKKRPAFHLPPPTDPAALMSSSERSSSVPSSEALMETARWEEPLHAKNAASHVTAAELAEKEKTLTLEPVCNAKNVSVSNVQRTAFSEDEAREALKNSQSLPEVGEILCRFLERRFEQVAILDLREQMQVLTSSPRKEALALKQAFAQADGLWDMVSSGVPYYGPAPSSSSWPEFLVAFAASTSQETSVVLPRMQPGGILVASLNRNKRPAMVIFATHASHRLYEDLSPTARLLQDLAAALTALQF